MSKKLQKNKQLKSSKPFVNRDLQIICPDLEILVNRSGHRTKSIYHHFGQAEVDNIPEIESIANDLEAAVEEVQTAREAWLKLKGQIEGLKHV